MYLNQKALWLPVAVAAVDNPYGDVINAVGKEISVRRQEHVEEVRLKDGTVLNSKYYYYTHEDVQIDDRLDGHLVVSLYDMRTLGGNNRLRRLLTL